MVITVTVTVTVLKTSYMFSDLRKERSFSYNKTNQISQIYFCNKTLHVSDSSSVHHQEFFTVHTAKVYVIQVC